MLRQADEPGVTPDEVCSKGPAILSRPCHDPCMDQQFSTRTMHIYCRVDVIVTYLASITRQAVADLRAADIDSSTEEDDLETAVEELRSDLAASVSDLVRISSALSTASRGWSFAAASAGPNRARPGPVPPRRAVRAGTSSKCWDAR